MVDIKVRKNLFKQFNQQSEYKIRCKQLLFVKRPFFKKTSLKTSQSILETEFISMNGEGLIRGLQQLSSQPKVWRHVRAWVEEWANGRQWVGIRSHRQPSSQSKRHHREQWRSSFLWKQCRCLQLSHQLVSGIRSLRLWRHLHFRICFTQQLLWVIHDFCIILHHV